MHLELPRRAGQKRQRRTLYGRSERQVLREYERQKAEIEAGIKPLGPRTSLARVFARYVEDREPGTGRRDPQDDIRHSTWEGYEAHVRLHIAPYLGPTMAKDLGKRDVEEWLAWLKESGVSRAMRRKLLVTLRTILDWAVGEGAIRDNPAKAVDLPRADRKEPWEPIDVETTARMIGAARGHRLEALFLIALTVGARLGELLALKWDEDVNETRRTITINHTLDRVAGEIVRYPAKTDRSHRTIRLPDSVWQALVQHRERQAVEATSRGWEEWGFVFTTRSGRPLRGDGAGGAASQFKSCMRRAGLPERRFHDLRHQAASVLLMLNGGNVHEVQQILGHSSHRMTLDLYGHLVPERLEMITRRLEDHYAGLLGLQSLPNDELDGSFSANHLADAGNPGNEEGST